MFVNEVNGVAFTIFQELFLRTRKRTWVDYNANNAFYMHSEYIGKPFARLIISDHRANSFLPDILHNRIESISDPELFNVYARGKTGKTRGSVFQNWGVVESIPSEARFMGYGMDFGFSVDPTTLVEVYMCNGELFVNELIYETGLLVGQLDERMRRIGVSNATMIIADSAAPMLITELAVKGWSITGAKKGPDSIVAGIEVLKNYKINVTRRSVNLRKEFESYVWKQDKEGRTLSVPVTAFGDHGLDALRYFGSAMLGANLRTGSYKRSVI